MRSYHLRNGKGEASDEEDDLTGKAEASATSEVNIDYKALPEWSAIKDEWRVFNLLAFEKDIDVCIAGLIEAFEAGYEPNIHELKQAKKLDDELINDLFAAHGFLVNVEEARDLEAAFVYIPEEVKEVRAPVAAAEENIFDEFPDMSSTTDYLDDAIVSEVQAFKPFSPQPQEEPEPFFYEALAHFPEPVKRSFIIINTDDFLNAIDMFPDRREELFDLLHNPYDLKKIVTDEDSFVECLLAFPERIDTLYEILFKSGMMKMIIDGSNARKKSHDFFDNLLSYLLICSEEFKQPHEKSNALYLFSWHKRFLYDADIIWSQPDQTAQAQALEALNRYRFFMKHAVMGAFQGKIDEKISTHIARFLDWREGARLARTCKAAHTMAHRNSFI